MKKIIALVLVTLLTIFVPNASAMRKQKTQQSTPAKTGSDFGVPFMEAIRSQNVPAAEKILLEMHTVFSPKGVAECINKASLLFEAVRTGCLEMVELLFRNGGDVNKVEGTATCKGIRCTPLFVATISVLAERKQTTEVVDFLLTKKTTSEADLQGCLIECIQKEHLPLIKTFLAVLPPTETSCNLLRSCFISKITTKYRTENYTTTMRYILHTLCLLNYLYHNRHTDEQDFAQYGNFEGNTPLHTIAEIGNSQVLVDLSLTQKISQEELHAYNDRGFAPIHTLIMFNDFSGPANTCMRSIECLNAFIHRDSLITQFPTRNCHTPLSLACTFDKPNLVKILIKNCNINPMQTVVGPQGKDITPFAIAKKKNFWGKEAIENLMSMFSSSNAETKVDSAYTAIEKEHNLAVANAFNQEMKNLHTAQTMNSASSLWLNERTQLETTLHEAEARERHDMTVGFNAVTHYIQSHTRQTNSCATQAELPKPMINKHAQTLPTQTKTHAVQATNSLNTTETQANIKPRTLTFSTQTPVARSTMLKEEGIQTNACQYTALGTQTISKDLAVGISQTNANQATNSEAQTEPQSYFDAIHDTLCQEASAQQLPILYASVAWEMPGNIIENLLQRGYSPFEEYDGYTIFHWAVYLRHYQAVKAMLIDRQSDTFWDWTEQLVNQRSTTQNAITPLCSAIAGGDADMVQLLLQCGAYVDTRGTFENYSPLSYAWLCLENRPQICDAQQQTIVNHIRFHIDHLRDRQSHPRQH